MHEASLLVLLPGGGCNYISLRCSSAGEGRRRGREVKHAEEKDHFGLLCLVAVWMLLCNCAAVFLLTYPSRQGVIAQLDKALIKTDWKFLLCPLDVSVLIWRSVMCIWLLALPMCNTQSD